MRRLLVAFAASALLAAGCAGDLPPTGASAPADSGTSAAGARELGAGLGRDR